jgi:hypothetical protein
MTWERLVYLVTNADATAGVLALALVLVVAYLLLADRAGKP